MFYLGTSRDGGSFTLSGSTFIDRTNEIYLQRYTALLNGPDFGTIPGRAQENITANITGAGTYYLDFGVVIQTGTAGYTGGGEGVISRFDDVCLVLAKAWDIGLDVAIVGGAVNESFGHSVAAIPNFNEDAYSDFIIGAPNASNSAPFQSKGSLLTMSPFVPLRI